MSEDRAGGGVLFGGAGAASVVLAPREPSYFGDLNLDRVVAALTAGREEYDLEPFFWTLLPTVDAIEYRHEVFADLRDAALRAGVAVFADQMRTMRGHLARVAKLRERYEREAWGLEAVRTYGDAVSALAGTLGAVDVASRGLRAFRDHLAAYAASAAFTALAAETREVTEALAAVRYSLTIRGDGIKVGRYEGEPDYTATVEGTFAKFQQGAVKDYRATFRSSPTLNHIEAHVLNLVAQLHPDVFAALDGHAERHRDFVDATVATFDREVQFYLAYLEYVERLGATGLPFCVPRIGDGDVVARDAFDLALADKLVPAVPAGTAVVPNDFALAEPERIIVVTGPNQGGKTTFARMFGQLHHLAGVGGLVPGRQVRLRLFDALFTHFEREEDLTNLSGKLEDDLVRIHEILERATPDTVVVMNESFTSTTLRDALVLGRAVLERMSEIGVLAVYVTFVDELASLNERTVSMVSAVDPGDPASRTFRIVRRPADGLAYAEVLADRYGLTYRRLRERLAS